MAGRASGNESAHGGEQDHARSTRALGKQPQGQGARSASGEAGQPDLEPECQSDLPDPYSSAWGGILPKDGLQGAGETRIPKCVARLLRASRENPLPSEQHVCHFAED